MEQKMILERNYGIEMLCVQSVAVHGCVWPCMSVYDRVWLCMAVYGRLLPFIMT